MKLSKEEQGIIVAAGLTERHARALLRLPTSEMRQDAIRRIRIGKLNVAATERLIEEYIAPMGSPARPETPPKSPSFAMDGAGKGKPFEGLREPENARVAGISPVTVTLSPQRPPSGVTPRKFALQNLTPLYNSIERTLSIFRKTGAEVDCRREEGEDAVRIIIHIPKKA